MYVYICHFTFVGLLFGIRLSLPPDCKLCGNRHHVGVHHKHGAWHITNSMFLHAVFCIFILSSPSVGFLDFFFLFLFYTLLLRSRRLDSTAFHYWLCGMYFQECCILYSSLWKNSLYRLSLYQGSKTSFNSGHLLRKWLKKKLINSSWFNILSWYCLRPFHAC